MPGPCVNDTDCIELEITGAGELEATLKISPDACNAAECRPNGLWAPDHFQEQSCVAVPPAFISSVAIPLCPGFAVVQSGTLTITNPSSCASGRMLRIENYGTTFVDGLLPGSRIVITDSSQTNGGGFIDSGFMVYENEGTAPAGFAWPNRGVGVMSCPVSIAPGETIVWDFERRVCLAFGFGFVPPGPGVGVTLSAFFGFAWIVSLA
jgi:hypothetical protein